MTIVHCFHTNKINIVFNELCKAIVFKNSTESSLINEQILKKKTVLMLTNCIYAESL